MPFYEYCCGQCGHSLEILQKMSDAPITLCLNCQQPTLIKLVSAAGFRLSGRGWYETDFKNGTDKKRNLSEPTPSGIESASTAPEKTKTASTPTVSSSSSSTTANDTTAGAA
jgi:putative FmdB family regulatory protein